MDQKPNHPDHNHPYGPYRSMSNDANAYPPTEPAATSGSPIAPGGNPISYNPLLPPPPPPMDPYGFYMDTPLPVFHRPKGPGHRMTVLVVVIILIVISGGALFGGIQYRNYQIAAQDNNRATVTTLNIAQKANSKATATAQVNVKATSVASTYPFFTNLVLSDPLVDNTHTAYGWTVNGNSYGGCAFSDGAYWVVASHPNAGGLCAGYHTNFSNFTFQADMTMKKGDKQSYGGLFFRGDSDKIMGYGFTINQQGVYALWLIANGSANSYRLLKFGTLLASQFTPGLSQTTTLAVVARGEQISLYVGRQLIITIQDSTYSQGMIGFMDYDVDAATTVAFDNAKVWA